MVKAHAITNGDSLQATWSHGIHHSGRKLGYILSQCADELSNHRLEIIMACASNTMRAMGEGFYKALKYEKGEFM